MPSNLPDGNTASDIERHSGEAAPCPCCGGAEGACICPECPECGTAGDPGCYEETNPEGHHGLAFSPEQRIGQIDRNIREMEEQANLDSMMLHEIEAFRDDPEGDHGGPFHQPPEWLRTSSPEKLESIIQYRRKTLRETRDAIERERERINALQSASGREEAPSGRP